MPHRLPQCAASDAVVIAASAIATATSNILLADSAANSAAQADLRGFLLPLLGAVLASGGAFLLNPQLETRRVVFGRCMVSLMAGTLAPSLIGSIHPALNAMALKPEVLTALAAASAAITYVIIKPLFANLYKRADADAARIAAELERRLLPPLSRALVENTIATKENTRTREEAKTSTEANTSIIEKRFEQEASLHPKPVAIVNHDPIPVTLTDSQPLRP